MNETNETNVPESGNKEQIVEVGFGNAMRPVIFVGAKLCTADNHAITGPNSGRWHKWTLYRVNGGYRVLDEYNTLWEDESDHAGLSRVLSGVEMAQAYPAVAAEAVRMGILAPKDIAEDADEPAKPIDAETLTEFD